MMGAVMGGRAGVAGSGSSFTSSNSVYRRSSGDDRFHTCRRFRISPVLILLGKWGYPSNP